MLITHESRGSDPLILIRSFADSLKEGLLDSSDVGALYAAIAAADAQIRPLLDLRDQLAEIVVCGPNIGSEGFAGGG